MAQLNEEQQKALDDLLALRDSPDQPDEDFEIEIYSGDKGARVPFSKGKSWLKDTFGIDIGDAPSNDPEGGKKPAPKSAKKSESEGADEPETGALRHFRQPQKGQRAS